MVVFPVPGIPVIKSFTLSYYTLGQTKSPGLVFKEWHVTTRRSLKSGNLMQRSNAFCCRQRQDIEPQFLCRNIYRRVRDHMALIFPDNWTRVRFMTRLISLLEHC